VDVFADPLGVKRITGYLPERPPLYEDMTVQDYLAYAATLKRVAKPRQAAARVLDQVDLSHVADRLIGKLSKGFRQRVGLAQALVHSPRVLLLDEPASGLDPTQRVELRRLITHLADGGTTVLLSTHVLGEIEAVCDHVVIIHRGRIRAHGPASALAERVGVRVVVGQSEGLAAQLSAIDGVEAVTQERADTWVAHGPIDLAPAIAKVAVRHELHRLEPAGGLEAAFLRLTQENA
jgi:ABC-2 type transport system ATP-binding protein